MKLFADSQRLQVIAGIEEFDKQPITEDGHPILDYQYRKIDGELKGVCVVLDGANDKWAIVDKVHGGILIDDSDYEADPDEVADWLDPYLAEVNPCDAKKVLARKLSADDACKLLAVKGLLDRVTHDKHGFSFWVRRPSDYYNTVSYNTDGMPTMAFDSSAPNKCYHECLLRDTVVGMYSILVADQWLIEAYDSVIFYNSGRATDQTKAIRAKYKTLTEDAH